MNTIFTNILAALQNSHLRWPLIGAVILDLAPIWVPEYSERCKQTRDILLMYGIIAAAQSAPVAKAIEPPKP